MGLECAVRDVLKLIVKLKFNSVIYAYINGIYDAFFCTLIRGPPSYQFRLKKFKLIGGNKVYINPKRRKSKDNPYTLFYDEKRNIYFVKFIDNKNKIRNVEVSEQVFDAFNKFELEDISYLHKVDKHIDSAEFEESTVYLKIKEKPKKVEEMVEDSILSEEIKKAIKSLPEIQQRRIKKYFFEDKTYEEIAMEENCSKVAVKYSIDIALQKISKKIKN